MMMMMKIICHLPHHGANSRQLSTIKNEEIKRKFKEAKVK